MANKNIQEALIRVYAILKFSQQEAKETLDDMVNIQQTAATAELLKRLSPPEIDLFKDIDKRSEEERNAIMAHIARAHENDAEFKSRAQAAVDKLLDEHIAYLKTRGDDAQKQAIAKIFAEIG